MKKIYITKSTNENYYFLDKNHKVIQLIHPELAKLYGENMESEISSYYLKKKAYLARHIRFQNDGTPFKLAKITSKDIENNIMTTSQLSFEVTDKCNFRCKYCGYGELYDNYDERNTKNTDIRNAKSLIDYYYGLCRKNNYTNRKLAIGFYGGEPLINFPFIREIIRYLEEKYQGDYLYSMTTNGMLLKQYIDYLVEKQFSLSISLDGDELSNSYRVDRNELPTFQKVVENVNYIREKHLLFYENNVSFSTVIHNRNSLQEVLSFFKKTFSKIPRIGRVNDSGVHPDKKDLFNEIYTNTSSFNYTNATIEDIIEKPFLLQNHMQFLQNNLFSVYKDYLALFSDYKNYEIYPTATCFPLKKRIFLTVNGKILPCEKIGHNYSMGNVSNGITTINFDEVAQMLNEMYEKIFTKQCYVCRMITDCPTCMFQSNLNCQLKKGVENTFYQSEMDFFESQPDIYNEIILKATLK